MKYPNIVAILFTAISLPSGFAQGTVVFMNDDRGLVKQWTTLTDPTLLNVSKGGAFVQIAYAAPGVGFNGHPPGSSYAQFLARNPGWTLGATAGFVAPGKFDGGVTSLDGVPAGGSFQYVFFGWPSYLPSFDMAAAREEFWGFAGPFTSASGGAGSPPVSLADSFKGMELIGTIPEPSSLALVVLGGVSMLLWRRRPQGKLSRKSR